MVASDNVPMQAPMPNEAFEQDGLNNFVKPCFEEQPWTTGKLNVIANPITDAIQWIVSQLGQETDARKTFQSHVEAELAMLRGCPDSAICDGENNNEVEDSEDLRGTLNKLKRDMQRLKMDQVLQKKQHEEKTKVAEGLIKMQFDRISRDVKARASQDEVGRQIDAVRSEVKTIASSVAQVAAEAALASSVANLHLQLDGVCAALQAQLDSLHDNYGSFAKQLGMCEDEIAILRAAVASNPTTSATTPTCISGFPDSVDSMTERHIPEHAESLGAHIEKGTFSKTPDLIPEIVMPVWQDMREDVDPKVSIIDDIGQAELAKNVIGSRRPSACSTAGTICGTESSHRRSEALSRDTDSCFGKASTPDGCMAWVEERIDQLRVEVLDLKKLFQQASNAQTLGGLQSSLQPQSLDALKDGSTSGENIDNPQSMVSDIGVQPHGIASTSHLMAETADNRFDESRMPVNENLCDHLKDWLRQYLKEQSDQAYHKEASDQPTTQENRELVISSSQKLNEGCDFLLGDDKEKSNLKTNPSPELGSVTREEVVALLKEEMSNYIQGIHPNSGSEAQFLTREEVVALLKEELNHDVKGLQDQTNQDTKDRQSDETCAHDHKHATSDIATTLSTIKERLRALEDAGFAKGGLGHVAKAVDLAAAKEGLRRLDQRVEVLENYRTSVDDTRKYPRSLAGDVDPKRGNLDVADATREIANVSQAVKGTQRSLDLTTSKMEDLSVAQKKLKEQLDVSLPHFLRALETVAQHVGLDMSTGSQQSSSQGGKSVCGSSSVKPKEGLNVGALRDLITSSEIPQLFVSPDALRQAVDALGVDLQARLNCLHRDTKDSIQGKADLQEIRNLSNQLDEMQQSLPSLFSNSYMQPFEEGVENPAGVRWPMQTARCISCNAKADLVAPWEQKVVPKLPWPQRQQYLNSRVNSIRAVQNSPPPLQGRRRENSLPAIDRSGS